MLEASVRFGKKHIEREQRETIQMQVLSERFFYQALPKALRTQALTALISNFGLVGLVRWVWLGGFSLAGLVWQVWFGRFGLQNLHTLHILKTVHLHILHILLFFFAYSVYFA